MSQSIFLNSYISGWLAAQTWMVICNLDSRSLEKHARGAEVVINVRKCLTEGGKRKKEEIKMTNNTSVQLIK